MFLPSPSNQLVIVLAFPFACSSSCSSYSSIPSERDRFFLFSPLFLVLWTLKTLYPPSSKGPHESFQRILLHHGLSKRSALFFLCLIEFWIKGFIFARPWWDFRSPVLLSITRRRFPSPPPPEPPPPLLSNGVRQFEWRSPRIFIGYYAVL